MRGRVLLAVDFSNQVYRATAAHKTLSHEGQFTGGLYGFLVGLGAAIQRTSATDVVLCRDKKPYRRNLLDPSYKADRAASRDQEMHDLYLISQAQVEALAQAIGLPMWSRPGFESDDLIGHAVRKYGHRFERIVGMSNDSDLWQLFDHPNFCIYKDAKTPLLGLPHLLEAYGGLSPWDYIKALALSGTHNAVKGLPNIGPKKSAAIVKDPVLWRSYVGQHREMIERNMQLIVLPHPELTEDGPVLLPMAKHDGFNVRTLYRFLAKYNIEATPVVTNALEQVLA